MDLPLIHLLKIMSMPAFVAARDGGVVFLNDRMRELLGVTAGREPGLSLIGLGIFQNAAEYRGFLRGFKQIGPIQRLPLPGTRLRSQQKSVILNAVWLEGRELIVGVLSINNELTLGVQQNQPPSKSVLLDTLPFFVLVTDGRGEILFANEYARDRLQIKGTENKVDPDQPSLRQVDAEFTATSWRGCLQKARKEGVCEYETTFLTATGKLQPVKVSINRVVGIPVRRVEIVARDISHEQNLKRRLRAAELEVQELENRLRQKSRFIQQQEREHESKYTIVTQSPQYKKVLEQVRMVAKTDSTVLITGESGTGKELIGRAIHAQSFRANRPMVVVNCGALPRDLIESELFGHQRGAFTGAHRDHVGRFELAKESTLFLDEIGELPLALQTRLLRFLQEGEFTPVGATEPIYADVRVISATNRNLPEMVREGTFRADLYYRLNVFPIENLPLRDRPEDIEPLVKHFIQKYARQTNSRVTKADPGFMKSLKRYSYPGNIRELENIIQRALIMSPGDTLMAPDEMLTPVKQSAEPSLIKPLATEEPDQLIGFEAMQKQYLERVLRATGGKVSGPGGAAEILEMKAQTLYSKIKKLGIRRDMS